MSVYEDISVEDLDQAARDEGSTLVVPLIGLRIERAPTYASVRIRSKRFRGLPARIDAEGLRLAARIFLAYAEALEPRQ